MHPSWLWRCILCQLAVGAQVKRGCFQRGEHLRRWAQQTASQCGWAPPIHEGQMEHKAEDGESVPFSLLSWDISPSPAPEGGLHQGSPGSQAFTPG